MTIELRRCTWVSRLFHLAALTLPIAIAQRVGAAPIDRYLLIQPIQVCDDAGLVCAGIGFFEAETDKIWAQAGIDMLFLTPVQLNNSTYLSINDDISPITDYEFYQLSFTGSPGAFGRHPSSGFNTGPLNLWFVDEIETSVGVTYGTAWIGANGVMISDDIFAVGRLDTIAHEIGHTFGLGHNNFGAGGASNLMTTGSDRIVPTSLADIAPDGARRDRLTTSQITQARSSSLLKSIPKVTVDTVGSTPFDTNDFFHVFFADGPAGITLDSLTLDFSSVNAFVDPTSNAPGLFGTPFLTSLLNGITSSDIAVSGDVDGSQVLRINLLNNAFQVGDSFNFGIDIDLFSQPDNYGATPEQLNGTSLTFGFSDGYRVTSTLMDFFASSHRPSVQSLFDGSFLQASTAPQAPPGIVESSTHHPHEENGEHEEHGEAEEYGLTSTAIPEPSTILGLLTGMGLLAWSKARFKSKP